MLGQLIFAASRVWSASRRLGAVAIAVGVAASPAIAQTSQDSNYGTVTPSAGSASGRTGGSVSLPAIVANRDSDGNECLGFGSDIPDFILDLDRPYNGLSLRVDSGGNDTTLILRSLEDDTVWCGDDTGSDPDASVTASFPAGRYAVWVGSFSAGNRWDYSLELEP